MATAQGGHFVVKNDNYGGQRECLAVRGERPNFTVTQSQLPTWHPKPQAYPFILRGCSWGTCSGPDSGLPKQVSALRRPLAPLVRGVLGSMGASLPRRLPLLLARARAVAATLHHSIASRAAIERAHELDAAVYVWTVDDPRLAERLVRDGADGIITNDPRIFTMFTA